MGLFDKDDLNARGFKLNYKKGTEGLTADEQKEYDQIQSQLAMQRRQQGQTASGTVAAAPQYNQ